MNQDRNDTSAQAFPARAGAGLVPAGMVCWSEAARMFGVDPLTIKRWEREGLIPPSIVCARRRLYPLDEIQRLVKENGRFRPPYPDPDRPGVYRIPLAGGGIRRREAIIDAEDLPLVQGRNWNFSFSNETAQGFVTLADSRRSTPLRRIILGITDIELRISHLNGDPLDCRRANLIVRTMAQLARTNRKMGSLNGHEYTSRFKGVCWETQTRKWVAQIRKDGKGRKIGRFHDEIAAAEAYDQAARELFGEHARLNFPEDDKTCAAAEQSIPSRRAA